MNEALEIPPVAVVFDIDGVIAPIGGPTDWGDDVTLGDPEQSLTVSPSMCAAIDKLDSFGQVACYWLTDWTPRMRHDHDILPGRDWTTIAEPETGLARAQDWAGDWWGAIPWWKWWALDEWLAEHSGVRRLIWVDDHLSRYRVDGAESSPSRRAWTPETALRVGALVDALLIAPDKHTGLRQLDDRIIGDWILGVR